MTMKKQLITFILFSWTISVWATTPLDTIPYWQIYYGKVVLIQGNTSQTTAEKREIRIKRDVVWELNISFNYDTRGQIDGGLEIKIGDRTLMTLKSVIMDGGFFVIPTRELIDTKTKGKRYELDFYYSDDSGTKNLKLGTIIFIT
jgi:hypothetical protein